MRDPEDDVQQKRPGLLVIGSGLVTSAISLALVFLLGLATDGFQLMGFYLNYVIPVGAIIVGLLAGSGYGVASWFSGVKIGKRLLWAVLGFQVLTYFVAQYMDFRSLAPTYEDGTPLGFFEYFDLIARSFAWAQEDGSAGNPLGLWGYAFRALEAAGFALGGVIAPALLFNKPYCPDCQVYMKSRILCLIPAGLVPKKLKKKDAEGLAAFERDAEQAFEEGAEVMTQLQSLAENDQPEAFSQLVQLLMAQKKSTSKLTTRISVALAHCRRCHAGFMTPSVMSGQGEKLEVTHLAPIELENQLIRKITLGPKV